MSVQNPGGVPNKPPFEMGVANLVARDLGLAPGTCGSLIANERFAQMRNEGGGFAANIWGDARRQYLGNADSIAESDSTRIFIHDLVIVFLT